MSELSLLPGAERLGASSSSGDPGSPVGGVGRLLTATPTREHAVSFIKQLLPRGSLPRTPICISVIATSLLRRAGISHVRTCASKGRPVTSLQATAVRHHQACYAWSVGAAAHPMEGETSDHD